VPVVQDYLLLSQGHQFYTAAAVVVGSLEQERLPVRAAQVAVVLVQRHRLPTEIRARRTLVAVVVVQVSVLSRVPQAAQAAPA
jgi:hypothetical protein